MKQLQTSFLILLVLLLGSNNALAKSSYKKVLNEWTQDGSEYELDNMEARLIWTATYQSLPFRMKRLEHREKISVLTEAEKTALAAQERSEFFKNDEFFVSVYAGSSGTRTIGKDNSLWQFVLILPDGRRIKSLSVEKVKVGELEKYDYPYITHWSRCFKVRFPKSINDNLGAFTLSLTGVPTGGNLSWKIGGR